jgi:putative transposase
MARPYSSDLRERIVRAVEAGASCNAVAAQFDVSISFVVKLLQRWRVRGTIAPDQYGGWRKPALAPHAVLIREIVTAENDITLEELRLRLAADGIATSCPTLCRFLKALKLTRKKRPSMRPSKNGRTLPKRERPGASANPS